MGFDLDTWRIESSHKLSTTSSNMIFGETYTMNNWQLFGASLDFSFPARTSFYLVQPNRGSLVHIATLYEKENFVANLPLALAADSHNSLLNRTLYAAVLLVGPDAARSEVRIYAVSAYTGQVSALPLRPRRPSDERPTLLHVHPDSGHLLFVQSASSGSVITEIDPASGVRRVAVCERPACGAVSSDGPHAAAVVCGLRCDLHYRPAPRRRHAGHLCTST